MTRFWSTGSAINKFRNMAARLRHKPVTYGKKKSRVLDDAGDFDLSTTLTKLTLEAEKVEDNNEDREPLVPLSHNIGASTTSTSQETCTDSLESTESKREHVRKSKGNTQIAHLTCLERVDPSVRPFAEYLDLLQDKCDICKIAQGSYAAVLRVQLRQSQKKYTIWKVMPLTLKKRRTAASESQTLVHDAVAEMKVLSAMSDIPGFVELRSARVLEGPLPQALQTIYGEWEASLNEEKREEAKTQLDYPEDQYWLLIEMSDAGIDLEAILSEGFSDQASTKAIKDSRFLSMEPPTAWDIIWGTAQALYKGEYFAEFEHRDLHPGNICINFPTESPSPAGKTHKSSIIHRYTNLEVTLIDYTLSRAKLPDGEIQANSMDKSLFGQHSDEETDEAQYNVYRSMQTVMQQNEGAKETRDWVLKWKQYMPSTNVLWLTHILEILLKHMDQTPKLREEEIVRERLEALLSQLSGENEDVVPYESAGQVVEQQLAAQDSNEQ